MPEGRPALLRLMRCGTRGASLFIPLRAFEPKKLLSQRPIFFFECSDLLLQILDQRVFLIDRFP